MWYKERRRRKKMARTKHRTLTQENAVRFLSRTRSCIVSLNWNSSTTWTFIWNRPGALTHTVAKTKQSLQRLSGHYFLTPGEGKSCYI